MGDSEKKKADAVFEGAVVKSIGLVGAAAAVEEAGYEWVNLAGTSAGSILAALLAADYSAEELRQELIQLNFRKFLDEDWIDRLGVAGKALSLWREYGIFEGDVFQEWLEGLLQQKGKTKFGDILTGDSDPRYKYRFQAIAADLTDRKMLVLPRDLEALGYDPDEFSISRAVRMSMSIPLFFEPVMLPDADKRPHMIVDGGLLSIYPIWLLDDGTDNPPHPTFGFKQFSKPREKVEDVRGPVIDNPLEYVWAVVGTLLDGHDNYHISRARGDFQRTIGVQTEVEVGGVKSEIHSLDFDITPEQAEALFQNGVTAGKKFLQTWDFEKWVGCYRKKPPTRTDC